MEPLGRLRKARLARRLRRRKKQNLQCRRVVLEPLEDRRLLAALARFDFDDSAAELGPSGWTKLLDDNASTGTTGGSGIGIRFATPIAGTVTSFDAATIPSDAALIQNGFVKNGLTTEEVGMSFMLTNLHGLKSYEIWILGSNNTASQQTQRVAVQGAHGTTSFNQTIDDLDLWINQSVGENAKPVTDFSPAIVTAPLHADLNGDLVNETYVINVSVTKLLGFASAQVAGVVIREHEVVNNFTLPTAGGPFTLQIENGQRVLKNNGGSIATIFATAGALTINGTDAANDALNHRSGRRESVIRRCHVCSWRRDR